MNQRGSVVLWVPIFVLIAAASILGLSRLGQAGVARARSDAVADVTALAAVSGGPGEARRVARAGSADLVGYRDRDDGAIEITILRGSVTAQAAAADTSFGASRR